ncbi:MAG: hypothetical protein IPN71_10905 [Fibrobacteres bacterium]|nr:hypothetical protein [Fibrobacterota bacterium]
MMPATSRSVRLAVPALAFAWAIWVSGCALPFLGGATKLDPKAVVAASSPDSLRAIASKVLDSARGVPGKPGKVETVAKNQDTSAVAVAKQMDSLPKKPTARKDSLVPAAKSIPPVEMADSTKITKAVKLADSLKSVAPTNGTDSVKIGSAKPEQLDPSERSRDPNAWSDLLMAGDTVAGRELSAVSRILHRWYKKPIAPMLSAWPDLWGHVAELSLTRSVDTMAFSPKDSNSLVLDLRRFTGLRKLRASQVGLDKKRLISILVGPALEEIDLSGNRLELLEVVAEGLSELRHLDVSNNKLTSLRLVGVSPKVLATGNRLCSRLLGLPGGERADKVLCKDFPAVADSLGRSLLERWRKSGLPGEIASAKVALATDILPGSLPQTKWSFPIRASGCAQGEREAKFWAFGVVGYDGSDALLVGSFPALAKDKIRPGMSRAQVMAVLGKPARSQGSVDAWASEKTADDRLWLGVRFFYDMGGRLEGVWIRRLAPSCKS